MKKTWVTILGIFIGSIALAGFQAYQSTTSLGVLNKIKCSTGLTCTVVGDKLNMVSSPSLVAPLTLESGEIINNTVDDTVEIISNDEVTTLQVTGFEAKNAVLNLWADQGDDAADKFSLTSTTSNTLLLKNNTTTLLTVDVSGNMVGTGANSIAGVVKKQVAATATTITIAQCGSTFINSGAVQMELPEASTALGCRLTFITGNASNFDVNPDNADQILVQTNAAGDAMRNATLGNSITIEAISASQWAPVSVSGTWSDIN